MTCVIEQFKTNIEITGKKEKVGIINHLFIKLNTSM